MNSVIHLGISTLSNSDSGLYSFFIAENSLIVKCEKLDNILHLKKFIDPIKIDVEGIELDVLKSAQNILVKHKPILFFEVNKNIVDNYDEICLFLASLGYSEYSDNNFFINKSSLKFDVIWTHRGN